MVAPKVTSIWILDHGAKFEVHFDLYIDYFLHNFFEASWHSILLFYFNLDRGFETFPKIADYS